jgi:predicted HicB family RNase H-like nuclease
MPDCENGLEENGLEIVNGQTRDVFQAALELYYQDPTPDWVTFFRQILGLKGAIRRTYHTREELQDFEQSEEYAEILNMLTRLRERTVPPEDPNEPIRVITIRVPKSLHEALRAEAYEFQTSMNKLCISKLLQFIDNELIPRERWKRVAERNAEVSPEQREPVEVEEEAAEVDDQAEQGEAGVDL